jgi:hypothetical protein
MIASHLTPLWPAGHLPLKGGDQKLRGHCPFCTVGDWQRQNGRLISPLEGEMAGRPEGGVQRQGLSVYCFKPLVEAA